MSTNAPLWKQSLRSGSIGGAIVIFLALVGVIETFSQRYVISGVVTMSQLFLLLPLLLFGYNTIRKGEKSSTGNHTTARCTQRTGWRYHYRHPRPHRPFYRSPCNVRERIAGSLQAFDLQYRKYLRGHGGTACSRRAYRRIGSGTDPASRAFTESADSSLPLDFSAWSDARSAYNGDQALGSGSSPRQLDFCQGRHDGYRRAR